MIESAAAAIVVLAGLYLIVLALLALLAPRRAGRFLLGFAGSAPKHYAELFLRLIVGAALVLHAPHMLLPRIFTLFGWILIVTTAALCLIPWRWHRRFAAHAVPRALPYLTLIGLASLALGALVVVAVWGQG